VGRKGGQNGLSRAIFSAYSTRVNAGIAQLVEQLICNQQVVGSNPTAGSFTSLHATVDCWAKALSIKKVDGRFTAVYCH
jgi:hypothetical protein